jgi:NTP pyrophosphatase (non-canonical NTP hydrolase)
MKTYSNKTEEILNILQEECAEVIQAISKCRRFGMENVYLNGEGTQREQLVQELGDVRLLIELLHAHQLFTEQEIKAAERRKATKLSKWSTVYEN